MLNIWICSRTFHLTSGQWHIFLLLLYTLAEVQVSSGARTEPVPQCVNKAHSWSGIRLSWIQSHSCPSLTVWTDSRPVCLFSPTKLLQLFLHLCRSAAGEQSCCQPHQQEIKTAPQLQRSTPPRIHLLTASLRFTSESKFRNSFKVKSREQFHLLSRDRSGVC